MKTQQYGNWYEVDIQKGKNKIRRRRRSWMGYCFREKKPRKNKNREELGGCGFLDKLHSNLYVFLICKLH